MTRITSIHTPATSTEMRRTGWTFSAWRGLLLLGAATAVLLTLRAPTGGIDAEVPLPANVWDAFAVNALDIEPANSIDEVIARSDAIVLGTIVRLDAGRVVGEQTPETPGTQVLFVDARIEVFEVLRGSLPTEHLPTVTLELLLPGRTDFSELPALNTKLPSERSVFFLRSNATTAVAMGFGEDMQRTERDRYHLTVLRAILADEAGRVVAPVWADHQDFFDSLEGQAFEDFKEGMRSR